MRKTIHKAGIVFMCTLIPPTWGRSPNSIDSLNHFMDTVTVATSSSLGFDVVLGRKQIHLDK